MKPAKEYSPRHRKQSAWLAKSPEVRMHASLADNAIPIRRPHFHLEGDALKFLISRRPYAHLDTAEQAIWNAIDGTATVQELRTRFTQSVDNALQRFIDLDVCEQVPSAFPPHRRRILIIEPHMDDAALSVGATMWQRRNECEFTLLTVAGTTNFTTYWHLDRDYFDVNLVSGLRKSETALFLRHVGGRHLSLDQLEAPLRYCNGKWSQDWYRQHMYSIFVYIEHWAKLAESEKWSGMIAESIRTIKPEEVWMPLGVGIHIDHQLCRDACLQVLLRKREFAAECVFKLYQDVPYAVIFPHHTAQLVKVLKDVGGARLQKEVVNITSVMANKLHLVSIFGSQFKMSVLGPRIQMCARQAGKEWLGDGEVFYHIVEPPCKKVDPLLCNAEIDAINTLAQGIVPWLRRNRSAPIITFFMPVPAGRWLEDVEFLLKVFPSSILEMHVTSFNLAETEGLSSSRVVIRVVKGGFRAWCLDLARTLCSRRKAIVVLPGRERGHYLSVLNLLRVLCDAVVAPTMNHLVLGIRMADYGP